MLSDYRTTLLVHVIIVLDMDLLYSHTCLCVYLYINYVSDTTVLN